MSIRKEKKYNRPNITLTDIAQNNMGEYLKDYIEIEYDELLELDRNTDIRYITLIKKIIVNYLDLEEI